MNASSAAPGTPVAAIDAELFPPAFLRLLGVVPAAVDRFRASLAEGRRAVSGPGGRFLFRGHRAYRSGDDLRRIDWRVAGRLDRLLVRQFDAERDVLTEVWLDGSASMGLLGARAKGARAAALAAAVGVAAGGRARLGVLRSGRCEVRFEAARPGHVIGVLTVLSRERPEGRADLEAALPLLVRRLPRGARLVLVSDLLSRADPGVLHALAGRGIWGECLHLRVPEVTAPEPESGWIQVKDVETGEQGGLLLDAPTAARIAARAQAHAERWAHHAQAVGLRYLPFAPSTSDEALLRRLAEDAA